MTYICSVLGHATAFKSASHTMLHLIQHFLKNLVFTTHKQDIDSRQQGPREPTESFADDIDRLVHKATTPEKLNRPAARQPC